MRYYGFECASWMNDYDYYCADSLCPTCTLAGFCDATCGFCSADDDDDATHRRLDAGDDAGDDASGDDAGDDDASGDDAGGDDASGDDASGDDASGDDASSDDAGDDDDASGDDDDASGDDDDASGDDDDDGASGAEAWNYCIKFGSALSIGSECTIAEYASGAAHLSYPFMAWTAMRDIINYYEGPDAFDMARIPSLMCPDCDTYAGGEADPYFAVPFAVLRDGTVDLGAGNTTNEVHGG